MASDSLSGLKSFAGDYPSARLLLAYGGSRKLQFEKIEAWPMEEFLKGLPEILGNLPHADTN